MQIRKLKRSEHNLTRFLYEEVFSEDDSAFVDYYYKWKTKDNEIYVAEDADGIHAMLHLNPFSVVWRGEVQRMHYIVAVATQEQYRHRGLMRSLLERAEQDMRTAGEKFTFLMPASEKIYAPFGYRFFGWQRRGILNADREKNANGIQCRPVLPQEYDALARFVNETLGRQAEFYVHRDTAYYERLCAEQQCQNGDVMVLAAKDGRILGTFCTAVDGGLMLREIILDTDCFEAVQKVLQNWIWPEVSCKVEGCQTRLILQHEAYVPLMMGKVPGGEGTEVLPESERVFLNEVV